MKRKSQKQWKEAPLHTNILGSNHDERKRMASEYAAARPFAHLALSPLCDDQFMAAVRDELLLLPMVYKETDLFRLRQSPDFANLDENIALHPELATQLRCLLLLRDRLYSREFRTFIEQVTGCGPLLQRADMAANIYERGSHLLTHDDVIGTRKISYIIYFSDDGEWREEDGGALELYPLDENDADDNSPRLPACIPNAWLPPTFNTMGFFTVVPGVSYHSVQEVLTDSKRRITIQGWYHAASVPPNAHLASLQQIQHLVDSVHGAWRHCDVPHRRSNDAGAALADADKRALALAGMNPVYLQDNVMQQMAEQFADEQCLLLNDFLIEACATDVLDSLSALERADDGGGARAYTRGVDAHWRLVGPPHIQRYLELHDVTEKTASESGDESGRDKTAAAEAARHMAALRDELIASDAFARFLVLLSAPKSTRRGFSHRRVRARRFRPALDYTVATAPYTEPLLDVTLCLCAADDAWENGDYGGFECYVAAENETNPDVVAVYRANEEEEDDDEEVEVEATADKDGDDGSHEAAAASVINISANSNSLSIALRTQETMRFVKYVSGAAPSSRFDVSAEFRFDAPFSSGSEEEEDEEDE